MGSLCDDTQWGPWVDGNISLCFQDMYFRKRYPLSHLLSVVFGLHSLFIVIFGGWRVKELISKYHIAPSEGRTILYRLTLGLNIACAALPILKIIVDFFADEVRIYETVSDGYICLAWCIAIVVVLLEHERGQSHDWSLRVWYLLAYMLGAIKLQALIDTRRDSWDLFFFVPAYIAQTILAIIALFFNAPPSDGSYQKLPPSLPVEEDKNPLETANWFSKVIYSWMSPLMSLGHQRPLQEGDLFDLVEFDTSKRQSQEFKAHWKEEQQRVNPSLPRAIFKTYIFHFALAAVWKVTNDVLLLVGPTFLQKIIAFLQDNDKPLWVGALYAFGLLSTSLVQTLAIHLYWFMVFRVGMRMRAGLVTAIYRKSFKLSAEVRQKFTVGEITNHMSVDAQRLMDTVSYLHMIWSGPLQIIVSLVLLWQYIGASVLAGVGVMILTIPLNIFMARKLGGFQKEMLAAKDKRTKAVNEVLQGMRIIKFFAWEGSFLQKITGIREGTADSNSELTILQKTNYIKAFTFFFWSSTPLLVSVCTFTVFALSGGVLTASNVFTALALFNILRFPLNMLPQIISGLVEAKASVTRLQAFLGSDELDLNSITRVETGDDAIVIEDGEFRWREGEEPSLCDINLRIPRGSLVAVVGSVGAGKSSLVNALLANVRKTKGSVTVSGTVAYCSQQAWMQNASLRQNILFGKAWDQRKYDETLHVCQLGPDVAMLPAGDETEIGEKGINLSGGQKQRVSIARAVYQEADIYLLDDPLSAVDAHVGKAIFKECFVGALARRTRVLVTHQLQYLHAVDKIVVMKGGRISEVGTYEQLMAAKGEFASLMTTHVKELDMDEETKAAPAAAQSGDKSIEPVIAPSPMPGRANEKKEKEKESGGGGVGKKLIAAEEREVGSVGFGVYRNYMLALGGIWILGLLLTGYMVDQSTRVGSDWWLSVWADENFKNSNDTSGGSGNTTSTRYYLGIYLAWGASNCLFVLGRSLLMAWASLEAARVLHNNMLKRVMRAPMSFFDTTPIGRILNRFSKDMYSVDESLPRSLGMFLSTVLNVIGAAFVISVATPWFLVAALPMAWVYHWVQRYYLDGSRELQRLDSISKSPIFAHFSETLSGVPTIRAYNLKGRFVEENERKLDANQRAYFASIAANRWLSVRLESLGTGVVFLSSLFAVLNRDNIDPGLAGLAISYAMNVTSTLNWMVRMSTDLETQLVAVERVHQYTTLQTEAPPVLPYRPPNNWPTDGSVQFNDLKLRYRPGLDLVLKGVSAQIRPREKIGVVGRTGAGKSSLMLALFRLVEPAEGGVQIDGEDISRLGLDDLRSRLSIIPQDPILFEGTVRSNLDPFNQYDDADLWAALESVHLKAYVGSQEKKLLHPVAEGGENLSVGQRQLLCLGRALLKKAKILVMDEATAAVDFETDALIQKTIRTEFKDRTVLTIAHRINTIIDYDRVMVLDAGRVIEFDSPQALLADQRSVFFSLAHSHGSTK